MVAPSLEMVTWPLSSWMSLSMPRGPRVVRTTSTTAWQALMLEMSCALPCDVSVPSFRRTICGCNMAPGCMPGIPPMGIDCGGAGETRVRGSKGTSQQEPSEVGDA